MRMLNPPHPGDFIRTEILAPRGLTVTAAADVPCPFGKPA
jgi:plasmid maintenance system antidote protein VapI